MKLFRLPLAGLLASALLVIAAEKDAWIYPFKGDSLGTWTAPDPSEWAVKDGVLTGKGARSHLFSPDTHTNVEIITEVKLNHSGNSGIYFRTQLGKGFPKGYETQVENTSPDPQKTGSLYNLSKVSEQLIQDDTWWTQHVIAIGNRTIIQINGKTVTDFVDEKKTHTSGHLALQQHDDKSVVQFRNYHYRPLPDDEAAALKLAGIAAKK